MTEVAADSAALAGYNAAMPFAQSMGVQFTSVTPERVVATLEWRETLCTVGGALHGGALMSLADAVGAVLAFANLPAGAVATSTIESKTNMFRPVLAGTLTAHSTPLHVGRTTAVIETEVRNEAGQLVSKTTQTQAFRVA